MSQAFSGDTRRNSPEGSELVAYISDLIITVRKKDNSEGHMNPTPDVSWTSFERVV